MPSTRRSAVSWVTTDAPSDEASVLASPKSRILTRFSAVSITFCGFRSRWTMFRACAAAKASAIWAPRSSASLSETRSGCESRSRSDRPSMYSMAMKYVSSAWPSS